MKAHAVSASSGLQPPLHWPESRLFFVIANIGLIYIKYSIPKCHSL